MLNITKLQKSTEGALVETFSEKCKSSKDIEVYDLQIQGVAQNVIKGL